MISFSRILVPTDLSDASIPAVRYAAALGEKLGSEIILLYIVADKLTLPDSVMPTPLPIPDLNQIIESAKSGLDALITRLDLAKLKPRTEVRVGAAAEEVTAAAGELKADLICLGTHGRGGLAHMLLGSIAETVIRHAPCPVLTVRSS